MKKLIAANWKMYKTLAEAKSTVAKLLQLVSSLDSDTEVAIFPPFTSVSAVAEGLKGHAGFFAGGQNVYPASEGAFTGEISPAMLLDAGCTYVLAGHSERRHVLGESSEFVGSKVAAAAGAGLGVILCVGETLAQREAGDLAGVLEQQLLLGLKGASALPVEKVAIAYEPVWAIGTGKVAGSDEIVEAHGLVRKYLKEFWQNSSAVRILYGGSVKPDNAAQIKSLDNVDGLLVGGASLEAETFAKIIQAK